MCEQFVVVVVVVVAVVVVVVLVLVVLVLVLVLVLVVLILVVALVVLVDSAAGGVVSLTDKENCCLKICSSLTIASCVCQYS